MLPAQTEFEQEGAPAGAANLSPGAVSSQERGRRLPRALALFIGLQCLDLATTLAAFSRGGIELNPMVSGLMPWTGRALGVITSKAVLIALFVVFNRRQRILYLGNILYSAIVIWNLGIICALR